MGDHIDTETPGEAFDAGDKATAKAMSVAFRTCLLQALCRLNHLPGRFEIPALHLIAPELGGGLGSEADMTHHRDTGGHHGGHCAGLGTLGFVFPVDCGAALAPRKDLM
jgi:hypothetical protein